MNKFRNFNVKVSFSIKLERSMGACEVRMINCAQLALSASREHYISPLLHSRVQVCWFQQVQSRVSSFGMVEDYIV